MQVVGSPQIHMHHLVHRILLHCKSRRSSAERDAENAEKSLSKPGRVDAQERKSALPVLDHTYRLMIRRSSKSTDTLESHLSGIFL